MSGQARNDIYLMNDWITCWFKFIEVKTDDYEGEIILIKSSMIRKGFSGFYFT